MDVRRRNLGLALVVASGLISTACGGGRASAPTVTGSSSRSPDGTWSEEQLKEFLVVELGYDAACVGDATLGRDGEALRSSLLYVAEDWFPAEGIVMTEEVISAIEALYSCQPDEVNDPQS
jgi:hypothetical protein